MSEKKDSIPQKDELQSAAKEWTPESPNKTPVVTLVEDPFQIQVEQIQKAQNSTEELDLDKDLQGWDVDSEHTLSSITEAIASEDKKHLTEMKELSSLTAHDTAVRLAAEIAEDEALSKELAQHEDELSDESIDPELQAVLPKTDENGNLDISEVESCLEALLFISDKPLSIEKLRELLGPDFATSIFREATSALQNRYQKIHHGIELVEVGGGWQFRTKPGRAALAKKLAKIHTQRLSMGAMETLAIVAYRQPVMKEEIDKVRGVDSSHFIRTLLERKLIKIAGRSELPGRPMIYSTTQEFLELFGLNELSALPSLREIEQMIPASQSHNVEDEDPRVKEMRRLVGDMKKDTSTNLQYDPREDEQLLKEIRERIHSIPVSTPFIEEQKLLEKQAALAATEQQTVQNIAPQQELL